MKFASGATDSGYLDVAMLESQLLQLLRQVWRQTQLQILR